MRKCEQRGLISRIRSKEHRPASSKLLQWSASRARLLQISVSRDGLARRVAAGWDDEERSVTPVILLGFTFSVFFKKIIFLFCSRWFRFIWAQPSFSSCVGGGNERAKHGAKGKAEGAKIDRRRPFGPKKFRSISSVQVFFSVCFQTPTGYYLNSLLVLKFACVFFSNREGNYQILMGDTISLCVFTKRFFLFLTFFK